jgi:TonB family protein
MLRSRMAWRHFLAVAFALLSPLASFGAAAQPMQQTAVWNVDYGERRCALLRQVRGAHDTTLSLRIIPGSDSRELHFLDAAQTRLPFAGVLRIAISFAPAGITLHGHGSYTRVDEHGPWILEVNDLDAEFLDRFAEASSISVRTGSRHLFAMDIPTAGSAIRALRQCNEALLRNWGVDPDLRASLSRQPELIGHWSDLFRNQDFPEEAIQRRMSGMSTVRITIGVDGRIGDCATLVSSRSELLDRVTCAILRERARLRPGLDRDGHAIPVTMIQSVGWVGPPSQF